MRIGNAVRTAHKAPMAVIVCSLAYGPITFLLEFAGYVIGTYPGFAEKFQKSPSSFLLEWLTLAIGTLPVATAIALGIHVLSRMRWDSFLVAVPAGGVIGYLAVCMLQWLMFGTVLSLGYGVSFSLVLAAVDMGVFMLLSGLYWLLVVKGARRRMLGEYHQQAIRAME
jgi:hypothetical protein